ncbi:MAG: ribonuclease H-like domain-containing protein [Saprospiraceae bacterium]
MEFTRPQDILFFDIETVSSHAQFNELSDNMKALWKIKANAFTRSYDEPMSEENLSGFFEKKAAIFAEFGKVVCISVARFNVEEDKQLRLKVKSFAGDDEAVLLRDFAEMLNKRFNKDEHRICGHNIREFDIPYLCRRMSINKIPFPRILNMSGKKPWENAHIDTMQYWKFGDVKHYTSLNLLSAILGIDSPKDDIDGSKVGDVYWKEKDLPRISEYCQKDAITVAQLYLYFNHKPLLTKQQIEIFQ